MQGHRHRVAFAVLVIDLATGGAEKRIEVAGRAGLNVLEPGRGQREVEQDELAGAVGPDPDGDVVGFDVAVENAFSLQVVDRAEQIVGVGLELVGGQPAVLAELASQRLVPGVLEHDHRP